MRIITLLATVLLACPSFGQMPVHTINLITNDMVYDSGTNRIYVTIPSANGNNGNSIGIINPDTYVLESTVAIGSEPSSMAITDNGQYIYTGFANASIYRKFNVATHTAGATYPLGADSFLGPYYVDDIETVPGQPDAVAIARRYTGVSPRFAAVAIYDNGVARPTVSDWFGSGEISNNIEFKNSTTVYGYGSETTAYSFNELVVNSGGISLVSGTGMPQVGWSGNVGDFAYSNDRCYFRNGVVVDTSFSTPFVIGNFTGVFGPVAIDAANTMACFADEDNGTISFKRYNTESFLLYNSQTITQANGTPKKTICLGNGRYAFNTENKVVILNDPNLSLSANMAAKVVVYPNPAVDYIRISGVEPQQIAKITVFDLSGKLVLDGAMHDDKLDVSMLGEGIYLIKIEDTAQHTRISKIIKN